jgi:hypothetical protein
MKKFSLSITLTLLAGAVALSPSTANAQDEKQTEFERVWYATCYTEKPINEEKCYQQSKELLAKYPGSAFSKHATGIIKDKDLNAAWQKFRAALDTYYKPPQDAAKLESLFASGDAFLQIEPDQQNPFHLFALGQMAIAGNQAAALAQFYKNTDTVKGYVERAMRAFETAQASEKTKQNFDLYVVPLKDLVMANGNQFLGFRLLENDRQQSLDFLTKATQVRSKEGAGWKDPFTYWLRSTIYVNQYAETRRPYDAMTDEQKGSDEGKEIVKKVNTLLDTKLIPEYARVLATATKPGAEELYANAKREFDNLWKYRTEAPEKAADYIKNYVSDPTISSVAVPAKPEDSGSLTSPAPTTVPTNVKIAGGSAPAPGAKANGGGAKANGGASKPATAKGKTAAKPKGRKR